MKNVQRNVWIRWEHYPFGSRDRGGGRRRETTLLESVWHNGWRMCWLRLCRPQWLAVGFEFSMRHISARTAYPTYTLAPSDWWLLVLCAFVFITVAIAMIMWYRHTTRRDSIHCVPFFSVDVFRFFVFCLVRLLHHLLHGNRVMKKTSFHISHANVVHLLFFFFFVFYLRLPIHLPTRQGTSTYQNFRFRLIYSLEQASAHSPFVDVCDLSESDTWIRHT